MKVLAFFGSLVVSLFVFGFVLEWFYCFICGDCICSWLTSYHFLVDIHYILNFVFPVLCR